MGETEKSKVERVERWVMWGSTAILLPLFLWGLSLQRTVDLQGKDILALQDSKKTTEDRLAIAEAELNGLGSINTKIDNLTEAVDDLKENLEYIFRRELERRP